MAGERYNEEFKIAAVKQVTEGGYSIADVAKRLGITTKAFITGVIAMAKTLTPTKKNNPILMSYVNLKLSLSV